MDICRGVPVFLVQLLVDYHRNIIIDDHVLPDIGLGLMNLDIVDALLIDSLTLKYFLKDGIFVLYRIERIDQKISIPSSLRDKSFRDRIFLIFVRSPNHHIFMLVKFRQTHPLYCPTLLLKHLTEIFH
jgi:hypothetical protein